MLAGLTPAERSQLGLEGLTVRDLLYLNVGDTRQDEVADAQRFADWKASLSVLGIPFMDVVRVLVIFLVKTASKDNSIGNASGWGSGGLSLNPAWSKLAYICAVLDLIDCILVG